MSRPLNGIGFRDGMAADTAAIARLHAASWRATYRGSLSDAYLDGPIEAERLGVWAERFENADPALVVILAEEGHDVLGFVCAIANGHETFGSLVDNLHVTPGRKTAGIGRALMHRIALRLAVAAPERPVHLFVKQMNFAAQGFYARIGGTVDGEETHSGVDGSRSDVLRIVWRSPAALREATATA